MTNEEKALELSGLISINDDERYYQPRRCEIYDKCLEMAKWKDEELKKEILELEAKNDVLKSCLRDEKSEIEILRHRIEAEKPIVCK